MVVWLEQAMRKRETNMKLKESQVLLECTLLMRQLNHYHSFMCTASSKSDEQNILNLHWHHFVWNVRIQLKSRQLQISLEQSNFYAGTNVTFSLFIIFEGLSTKFIIFIFWPILILSYYWCFPTYCSIPAVTWEIKARGFTVLIYLKTWLHVLEYNTWLAMLFVVTVGEEYYRNT